MSKKTYNRDHNNGQRDGARGVRNKPCGLGDEFLHGFGRRGSREIVKRNTQYNKGYKNGKRK